MAGESLASSDVRIFHSLYDVPGQTTVSLDIRGDRLVESGVGSECKIQLTPRNQSIEDACHGHLYLVMRQPEVQTVSHDIAKDGRKDIIGANGPENPAGSKPEAFAHNELPADPLEFRHVDAI
ncbi:hypothetical protein Cob_v011134 [Colletotrichum orbiculare MAFF 240422]|uniref:Uncharacterized protein n=1 Tax=Colletotrichum orbiculare (strain 104-T / ATCC 96160 / CBS 514.97 / LARS 414 / MAFF 240422) TaxID=1213857 RepID=A0A484FCJ4_COLOR|nr:hypothetical protein Cob_v011134 [Colletotrichum orbiculare MAFF 240422]